MNDDRLQSLLEAAGRSAAGPPASRPGLAGRVRRLHVRRRRRRRVTIGLAAAMVLSGGVLSAVLRPAAPAPTPDTSIAARPDPRPTPRGLSDADVQRLRAEIAALDAEVERRLRRVRQMARRQLLHDELCEVLSEPQPPDPLEAARIQIETTALLLVDHAEYRAAAAGSDAAAAQYRQVLELFPHTAGAEVAQERLNQLSIEEGDL